MTITITEIEADLGELYDSVDGGTTSVKSMITRAEDFIAIQATADDVIVRPLADAMCVTQMMGSIDPVNKTIGSLSVGTKDLRTMYNNFMSEAKKAAVMKGISLDGLTIKFVDSADA